MLQQSGQYNDLSPKLLDRLTKRIEGFGKTVRYRFDIEQENPDKTYYNGKTIFPQMYTLDPTVFNIIDKDEDRPGKSKTKKIALLKKYEDKGSHGIEVEFTKIRIAAARRGILRLELDKEEDVAMAMILELHPKLSGGDFADADKRQVVSRIDEQADAATSIKERSDRRKALNAVEDMDYAALVQFADAVGFDSTQTESVLRNLTEELAESDSGYFNDLIAGKSIEIQALVKQAIDRDILTYEPVEGKLTWTGNKQLITVVSPMGTESEIVKIASFLHTGGNKADEVYKKLKSLVADAKKPVTA